MAVYRVIFNLQNYLKITTSIVFVTMELMHAGLHIICARSIFVFWHLVMRWYRQNMWQ